MATPLNSITLGGKTVWDDQSCAIVNLFWMHTGASRYGVGFFLMLRSDFNILIGQISPGNPSQTFPLVMNSAQGPGLTLQAIIAGAESLSTTTGTVQQFGDQPTDMMRVKVLDQRLLSVKPYVVQPGNYNCMLNPFSWDVANTQAVCSFDTLNNVPPTRPFTWPEIQALITDGANVKCPPLPTDGPAPAPTWIPYNLKYQNLPMGKVIDDFLSKIYYVCGYDFANNAYTCDVPGVMNQANTAMFAKAKPFVLAGAEAERNLSRSPSKLQVAFQVYNGDNLVEPESNSLRTVKIYQKTVNASSVGPTETLPVGTAIAIYENAAIANDTQLDAIATDIAPRWYRFFTCNAAQWEFAGIWPFSPDGAIRGVKWVSDSTGAKTIIRLNNDVDFMPLDDFYRRLDTATNQFIQGLGADVATMDAGSRTRQFWSTPPLRTLKIIAGGPTTGGNTSATGKYGAVAIGGAPVNVDITTPLYLPETGDSSIANSIDVIFENEAEQGFPPNFQSIPSSTIVEARFSGGYATPTAPGVQPLQVWRGRVEVPGIILVSLVEISGSGGSYVYDVYQFDPTWNGISPPTPSTPLLSISGHAQSPKRPRPTGITGGYQQIAATAGYALINGVQATTPMGTIGWAILLEAWESGNLT